MRRFSSIVLVLLVAFFTVAALGQSAPTQGIAPNSTYQNYKVDTVNLENGNVVLHIPLFTLPQDGGFKPINYYLTANSAVWTGTPSCSSPWACEFSITGENQLGVGIGSDIPFAFWTTGNNGNYNFWNDGEGNSYETLELSVIDWTGASHALVYNASDLTDLRTVDGSGYRVKYSPLETPYDKFSWSNNPSHPTTIPTLYNSDGIQSTTTTYTIDGLSEQMYTGVIDTNGNQISGNCPYYLYCTGYTDSMGRTINSAQPQPGGLNDGAPSTILGADTNATDIANTCPVLQSDPNNTQPVIGIITWNVVNTYGTSNPDPRYVYKFCIAEIHYHTDYWGNDNGIDTFEEYVPSGDDSNNPDENYGGGTLWAEVSGLKYVIQSVILPNGTHWGFWYDSANVTTPDSTFGSISSPPLASGLITEVFEPEGGVISYYYSMPNSVGGSGGYEYYTFSDVGYNNDSGTAMVTLPLLKCRYESASGVLPTAFPSSCPHSGTSSGTVSGSWWQYNITPPDSYWTTSMVSSLIATVTDPQSNVSTYSFGPGGETASINYEGSSTNLKETDSTYTLAQLPDPQGTNAPVITSLLSSQTTKLSGSTIGYTNYTYSGTYTGPYTGVAPSCLLYVNGPPWDSCTTVSELASASVTLNLGTQNSSSTYNAGGTLLKSTSTTYEADTNPSTYFYANLLHLPATVTTSDGTNSSETVNTYDNSTYSPSGLGHVTTSSNSVLGINTNTYWTPYGMPDHIIDGNGNTAVKYTYDSTTHMLPIQKQYPDGSEYASYDLTTNAPLWTRDLNSNQTNYSYDSIGRLIAIQSPDAAAISSQSQVWCYPTPTTVYKMTAKSTPLSVPSSSSYCTSTGSWGDALVQEEVVDGFARITNMYTLSGPNPIGIDTAYDINDNVASVSNPYINVGTPTKYYTTYTYDGLARPLVQTDSDTSSYTKSWVYSAITSSAITTVADENSNETASHTDILGRLTDVYEPTTSGSPSSTLHTNYAYNLFGLTGVTQYGNGSETHRTRSFSYDNLSRLTSSTNPETGTIGYTYDSNNNVLTKTDARGVVTNYSYDASNRLLSKIYTSVPSGMLALSSCYKYDTATNGQGKLGAEWTQSGSCSPTVPTTSGYTAKRTFLAYDLMGRIWNEQQCTALSATTFNCSSGPTPSTTACASAPSSPYYQTYCYDLAGNLTWSVNGVSNVSIAGTNSPISFANTYDAAGHLATLTSSWADSTHPGSLFTADPIVGYTPSGAIQNIFLGNNIYINKTYDTRLRVTGETATHP